MNEQIICNAQEKIMIIMPPPSVLGKVYCFPHRQLIFNIDRRATYHLEGL